MITPGSIQGTDQMYWWAAHALVRAGYEELEKKVRELLGHALAQSCDRKRNQTVVVKVAVLLDTVTNPTRKPIAVGLALR